MFVLLVVLPPEAGRLMAKYCLAFDTMKQFNGVNGHETLAEMVGSMGNGSFVTHYYMLNCPILIEIRYSALCYLYIVDRCYE